MTPEPAQKVRCIAYVNLLKFGTIHDINCKHKKSPFKSFCSCEGEDRTPDLWVMSPTSYRCSTSRCKCKIMEFSGQTKNKAVVNLHNSFTTILIHAYDRFEILLDPLVLTSRISPLPLYLTSLAPLASADNSLFTVIFMSLAPLALASQ